MRLHQHVVVPDHQPFAGGDSRQTIKSTSQECTPVSQRRQNDAPNVARQRWQQFERHAVITIDAEEDLNVVAIRRLIQQCRDGSGEQMWTPAGWKHDRDDSVTHRGYPP